MNLKVIVIRHLYNFHRAGNSFQTKSRNKTLSLQHHY